MTIAVALLLTVGAVVFVLAVRAKDLPEAEPLSPFQHLDERKAAIYDNLRDLQFEYRVGKLSDADYQQAKESLQRELAGVLAEIDRLQQQLGVRTGARAASAKATAAAPAAKAAAANVCPSCGAKFAQPLKFCGECGKAMTA